MGRGWSGGGLTIYSCSSLARSCTHATAFLSLPHQMSAVTTVEERSKRRAVGRVGGGHTRDITLSPRASDDKLQGESKYKFK